MKNKKLLSLCLASVLVTATAGTAFARPDVRTMTCAQAQALVQREHSIVLTTGAHTYDKFVSSDRYCELAYSGKRTWVATRDKQECLVGLVCKPYTYTAPNNN